jgi:hypothetical protein
MVVPRASSPVLVSASSASASLALNDPETVDNFKKPPSRLEPTLRNDHHVPRAHFNVCGNVAALHQILESDGI